MKKPLSNVRCGKCPEASPIPGTDQFITCPRRDGQVLSINAFCVNNLDAE